MNEPSAKGRWPSTMRVVSLLPSATELVAALGMEDSLCGISHACDFPPSVLGLPRLTRSAVPTDVAPALVDELVSKRLLEEGSVYHLDESLLAALQPDVVITQALCDVCAVNYRTVARAIANLPTRPELISLEPGSVKDILGDILLVGRALGVEPVAHDLARELLARWEHLGHVTASVVRPTVLSIEWPDPFYYGGHWVPEQIHQAGGVSILGCPGERSRRVSAEAVLNSDPDVIMVIPCGAGLEESYAIAQGLASGPLAKMRAVQEGRVFALDANSFFSRPSPRVVDGAEVLGRLLHPNLVGRNHVYGARETFKRVRE